MRGVIGFAQRRRRVVDWRPRSRPGEGRAPGPLAGFGRFRAGSWQVFGRRQAGLWQAGWQVGGRFLAPFGRFLAGSWQVSGRRSAAGLAGRKRAGAGKSMRFNDLQAAPRLVTSGGAAWAAKRRNSSLWRGAVPEAPSSPARHCRQGAPSTVVHRCYGENPASGLPIVGARREGPPAAWAPRDRLEG
jgi:hypothetical protein